MGSGASAGLVAAVKASTEDELKATIAGLPAADKEKIAAALAGPPSFTVYYLGPHEGGANFFGRAIGIYLTLDEAGATYEVKKPAEAPKDVGFAPPIITLESGQHMAQTPAILNVLGERFGLNGSTLEEKVKCQQMVMDLNDLLSEAFAGKLNENLERANKWFAFLEGKLTSKFLVKDTPTVADFHGVFAFEVVHKSYTKGDYSAFPKLTAWWARLNEHPCVKKMRSTKGVQMLP
mmetsp:Transcript_39890/g.113929  ORF Transcript_39890/g.113929 Transcript_39890/m.113929 type:complete len:235 (+) Transcript_39890:99-803(+)